MTMKTTCLTAIKRMLRSTRGDALLQTTAAIGAASIIAGTAAVGISQMLKQAKINRTRNEIKTVATVLHLLINDLGKSSVPRSQSDSTYLTLLVSDGETPETEAADGNSWTLSDTNAGVGKLSDYLYTNSVGFTVKTSPMQDRGWNGPYLDSPLEADPWGNRYVVSIGLFGKHRTGVAVVASAGPDGVLTLPYALTRTDLTETHGDDIFYGLE